MYPPPVAVTSDGTPWGRRLAIGLLLLGAAVRLRQYFGCPSYWYDEAYLLLNVFERSYRELLGAIDYNLVIPPGFLWLSRAVYTTCGGGELSMRLPAVASSLAALVLMVPLARRFVGSWARVGPVAFVALSKHAVMHAGEVRPYSTDLLVVEGLLLATCLYLSGDPSARARNCAFTGLMISGLFGPWLSFPSVFVLAGVSLGPCCATRFALGGRPIGCAGRSSTRASSRPFWLCGTSTPGIFITGACASTGRVGKDFRRASRSGALSSGA
jgi:4-amino-4-deoxy-L-arabinose transferase-like glycosyltransferase